MKNNSGITEVFARNIPFNSITNRGAPHQRAQNECCVYLVQHGMSFLITTSIYEVAIQSIIYKGLLCVPLCYNIIEFSFECIFVFKLKIIKRIIATLKLLLLLFKLA